MMKLFKDYFVIGDAVAPEDLIGLWLAGYKNIAFANENEVNCDEYNPMTHNALYNFLKEWRYGYNVFIENLTNDTVYLKAYWYDED